MPSGERHWTVLDDELRVVPEADAFLRHVRFGRDGSELTTKAYAGGIALFLRWCERTGRSWHSGVEHLGLFMMWLRHAGPDGGPGQVLAGPGAPAVRSARRVNAVLTAVRGMTSHAVSAGQAPGHLVPLLYEVADERDLPAEARGEGSRMSFRLRARHRPRVRELRAGPSFDEAAWQASEPTLEGPGAGQPARAEPAGCRRGTLRAAAAHPQRNRDQPGRAAADRLGTALHGSRGHRRDRRR
jgi:integrase/recombinase XerD